MAWRLGLIGASVVWIAAALALTPLLLDTLGLAEGYLALFCIYWLGFCAPTGLIFGPPRALRRSFDVRLKGAAWVPWAVAAQVAVVGMAALWSTPPSVTPLVIACAVAFGLVNGFFEEFAWRGAYISQSGGSARFLALGVALFTLWHLPLALISELTYAGGPVALMAGALALGAFWTVIALRTGAIGWCVLAHALTNALTFIGLIETNFAEALAARL